MFQKLVSSPVLKLIPFFLFFLALIYFLPGTSFFFSGAEAMILDRGFYPFEPDLLSRYRVMHLIMLLGVLGLLFLVFKSLFGSKIAIPSLIFLLTSGWVFLIGYWLSFDYLLSLYHSALFLTLLFYSKRQSPILLGLVLILTLGALLIDATGTTLFVGVLFFGAVRQQKQSKAELYFWVFLFLVSIGMVVARLYIPGSWNTYLGIQSSDYLLFYALVLMALWPFAGFIFAAIKDAISKWKKGDVWSIWLLTATFATIMSQSPAFILPVSLLVGKHIMDFDLDHYPYKPIVKYWSTFLWIIWFFLSIFLMTGGHLFQNEGGFRMGFQSGFGIWVFGLIAIIGMYGKHYLVMRLGLIGGNMWVTFSMFLILIPHFGNEFIWNKVWRVAIRNQKCIEIMENQKYPEGSRFITTSIKKKDFASKLYLTTQKGKIDSVDSIAGYGPLWAKEVWYLEEKLPLRSNQIKE
jgi:hypothetical protein